MSDLARLIVILGPTASGKSALGIELARKLNGEILVCDSTQVYRHFDIGTGKVPRTEQQGVPHHLVDLVEPEEVFTAGEYRQRALDALADMRRRNKMPIITAGTGLYLRALLEGLAEAPTRSEELRRRLRAREERYGSASLHRLLTRIDREAAGRIAPRDTQKTIRAIEIRLLAGKKVSDVFRSGRNPLEGFEVSKIGLLPPREALYGRINARVEAMIKGGWEREVREIVRRSVRVDAKPFQFIGYSELRDRIERGKDPSLSVPQIQKATRQFAKRQITWFRKEPDVHWFNSFGDDPSVIASAMEFLSSRKQPA